MSTQKEFDTLVERVKKMKETAGVDLSTAEDLSLAVMNLVSLEEHFYFTGMKTDKPDYFDLMGQVREMRKELLAKLINTNEGETWCISKHLLATSMRLIEVGIKLHSDNKHTEASEMFARAYKLYTMFWGVRLKLINTAGLKKAATSEKPWTLQDIINKMVNCCDE